MKRRGVPLSKVRAAVETARELVAGDGVAWGAQEWERVWSHLTPNQQHVIYLVVLVGVDVNAAAAQLGLTRGNVLGTWTRALPRLRRVLDGVR